MAQPDVKSPNSSPPIPLSPTSATHGFLRKLFGRQSGGNTPPQQAEADGKMESSNDTVDPEKAGLIRRMSRKVVPGLPRTQTFKRQQSEQRTNLALVEPTADERRAVSVDRRSHGPRSSSTVQTVPNPRTSAPGFFGTSPDIPEITPPPPTDHQSYPPVEEATRQPVSKDDEITLAEECPPLDNLSTAETHSLTTSQYDAMIHEELEKTWILNLSMHFRDRSRREKFFVTFREQEHLWRRVTISLDYRNAPPNSLEMDLIHTQYQRDKNAKIYEAIRESLADIQFYDTVTNLKLQTTDGRLHVHVVEDGNEIIPYPSVSLIEHLGCRRIREQDITFDSHMSGFVYKVKVDGKTLIKKEIPSPETVEEFLYEVNALSRLRFSSNVIKFHGVVVDDHEEYVKGLLISYAEQGALIDIIYDTCKDGNMDIPWHTREKWARQIVEGLSDVHESGFVQGDFTLSNIVIDDNNDAKIIDINRRGCPVGWEPPEATALIECNQRISMYIGVKSDLYQLGMVLWALATQEDEPESQGRPLILGPEVNIPDWYRRMAETCLSDDPRMRLQASSLLQMFPQSKLAHVERNKLNPPLTPVDHEYAIQQYLADGYQPGKEPQIRSVEPPSDWSYVSRPYDASDITFEPYYPPRGRSPPSPLPSNDRCGSLNRYYDVAAWAANRDIPSSYSDVDGEDLSLERTPIVNETAPSPIDLFEAEAEETPTASILKASKDAHETHLSSGLPPSDIRLGPLAGGAAMDQQEQPKPFPEIERRKFEEDETEKSTEPTPTTLQPVKEDVYKTKHEAGLDNTLQSGSTEWISETTAQTETIPPFATQPAVPGEIEEKAVLQHPDVSKESKAATNVPDNTGPTEPEIAHNQVSSMEPQPSFIDKERAKEAVGDHKSDSHSEENYVIGGDLGVQSQSGNLPLALGSDIKHGEFSFKGIGVVHRTSDNHEATIMKNGRQANHEGFDLV